MPAKKQNWMDRAWPFRHTEVRLNNDTNLIKIVAMITMLVDHLGAMVFPGYRVMRIIGRIAFPIYAYCIAVGCVYTKNIGRYLQRLALLALISQPLYVVVMEHTNSMMYYVKFSEEPLRAVFNFYMYSWKDPSILLSLVVGVAAIWTLRERKLWLTGLILAVVYAQSGFIDYGINGIILMLLMYAFINRWYISLPVVAVFMAHWGMKGAGFSMFGISFGIQMFALLALPLIYIPMRTGIRLNKWVFYLYYPAHLLIVALAKNWDAIMNYNF